MQPELLGLLAELAEFGDANDAETTDRSRKMLNITPDTGAFLTLLVKAIKSRNVLEIGTSNGYSTLWLAHAVGEAGSVTTVERSTYKITMAEQNFKRSGLHPRIRQITADADEFINSGNPGEYDLIFLDGDRDQYVGWWSSLQQILVPGGLIVVDNATSHADQLALFTQLVTTTPGYLTSLCPIGKGELLILKDTDLPHADH